MIQEVIKYIHNSSETKIAKIAKVAREFEILVKAMKAIEAAPLKARNEIKRCFINATKEARKWRTTGRLDPAEIYESGRECRLLKQF
jgi:hypothetical protein